MADDLRSSVNCGEKDNSSQEAGFKQSLPTLPLGSVVDRRRENAVRPSSRVPSRASELSPTTSDADDSIQSPSSIVVVPKSDNTPVGDTPDKHVIVSALEKSRESSKDFSYTRSIHAVPPWKTTFIRWGPLSGILGLFIATACIMAALGVLVGSQGQAVAHWSLEPSAYLAIFTAVANQSVRYATAQGVAIAWWYRASRTTTLSKLHHDWRSGTTLRGAITAGRHVGMLGIACIFSTLVAVDGPLLQKATSVISSHYVNQTLSLNITMLQELPHGFGAGWVRGPQYGKVSLAFNKTMPTSGKAVTNDVKTFDDTYSWATADWLKGSPLKTVIQGCSTACILKVRAPALAETACTTRSIPVNYSSPVSGQILQEAALGSESTGAAFPLDYLGFMVDTSLLLDEHESVNLVTGHSNVENCVGDFVYTTCTLESAVGEYEVSVSGNEITAVPGNPRIIAVANNTRVNSTFDPTYGWHQSTLANIVTLSQELYDSGFYLWTANDTYQATLIGNKAWTATHVNQSTTMYQCPSYLDPRPDIMQKLNQLMFYNGAVFAQVLPEGVGVDPGLPINTTALGLVQGEHNVYHSNFNWFIAAVLLEFTTIAMVLPTYWGFWKLGRSVSFSPLEVAKAFEAPFLEDFNSNSTARDMTKAAGDRPVRYGETRSTRVYNGVAHQLKRLAFAPPDAVTHPQDRERFDV